MNTPSSTTRFPSRTVMAVLCGLIFVCQVHGEEFEVTAPPKHLKGISKSPLRNGDSHKAESLSAHYTKYISANGYPILASNKVNDYALKEAAFLVNMMLAKRPDVLKAMIKSNSRMVIFAHDEFTTDLPEYADFTPKDYWDRRSRGFGGSDRDPVCSVAEENLLGYRGDPYKTECILIHEFAHNIHLRGLVNIDPTFDRRLQEAYSTSMGRGLWKGKYAAVNHHEYWAEGVQSWFGNNRQPDHDHNHVDTRKELIEYDSRLAQLCREVFGDTELVYTKPVTRLVGHLRGYDPQEAPAFKWPARLQAIQLNLELEWIPTKKQEAPNSRRTSDKTWVLFRNHHNEPVNVFWVDFQGKLKNKQTLQPNRTFWSQTYVGHSWLVTDEDDRPFGHFVAGSAIANATIPETVAH